jgi:hypothetical protein
MNNNNNNNISESVIKESKDTNNLKISPDLILDEKQLPKPALSKLLEHFKIEYDGTLKNLVEKTQKTWLRTPGKERWEIEEIKVEEKELVFGCFKELGCVNQIKACEVEYDYVLVLGALSTRMKLRTATVLKLWGQIKFKNLVFLVAQRPRDVEQEGINTFVLSKDDKHVKVKKDWKFNDVLLNTETELIKLIVDQIELPQDFAENVKITFVDTPMQKNKDGSMRRPNTGDTIAQWLKSNPKPGKCLFISNNPYIGYQDSVVRTYMPKEFTIETIGDEASSKEKISIYLDTIARWIYQENQRLTSISNK